MATKTKDTSEVSDKKQRRTIVMSKGKETKGTIVYKADDPFVNTVYVGKGCFDPMPDEITVIVKAGKSSE